MSMHMAHPALTTGGKRRGKVKFRNADAVSYTHLTLPTIYSV